MRARTRTTVMNEQAIAYILGGGLGTQVVVFVLSKFFKQAEEEKRWASLEDKLKEMSKTLELQSRMLHDQDKRLAILEAYIQRSTNRSGSYDKVD